MIKQIEIGTNQLFVFEDVDALIRQLASKLHLAATKNAVQSRPFYLSVSGGNTPKKLNAYLATDSSFGQGLWQHFHVFFTDERYVPHTDADSNYKMTRETWLDHVPIPAQQIYPVPTDCDNIEDCVSAYAKKIQLLPLREGKPCFDLILLGMGDDGHTASLFPATPVLLEQNNVIASVHVAKLNSRRISFTYPLINNARQIIVMVTGQNKAATLKRVFFEPDANLPIQGLQHRDGVHWYLDAAAAAELM